jgi:hypothetical protein
VQTADVDHQPGEVVLDHLGPGDAVDVGRQTLAAALARVRLVIALDGAVEVGLLIERGTACGQQHGPTWEI